MNKIILTIGVLLINSILCFSENLKFKEVLKLGLPVVEIITENEEEPTCELIDHPEGCMGTSIQNVNKVPASLTIYSPEGEILFASGDYKKNESGLTIKVRGNTSARQPKKHFKLKFQKKVDLLLKGDDFKDKNWVLLNDKELRMYYGFGLSQILDQEWTPAYQYVNIIINNDFRGIYLLGESVDRNVKSRINVSDDGYIAEHDPYWWNEDGQYLPSQDSPSFNYTLKYPDFEDLTEEQKDYISLSLEEYENSVKSGTYDNYIAIESFVKWVLGHDILGTLDGGGANLYYVKYDNSASSKIEAGPLWDFDTSYLNEDAWSGPHEHRFTSLFTNVNPIFKNEFVEFYCNNSQSVFEELDELCKVMAEGEMDYLIPSLEENQKRWGRYSLDLRAEGDYARDWFATRKIWLDNKINNELAGIENIEIDKVGVFTVYNLQGIKMLENANSLNGLKKGLYIINGRKVYYNPDR